MVKPNENDVDMDVADDDSEYQLALIDGIDDDTLKETLGTAKFSINSYGADYTVDSLVKRMRDGAFKIPKFQRRFVWSHAHSSKFIESLLMGLPVPGIFLYKESETNQHLVIDGQQRLRTLQAFYDGTIREKKFRLIGVREPWLNKTYEELDTADALKLDDSIVHATIFQQESPKDVLDSIYFVFERINSGGIRLSPQEIRNCINDGPFIDLIKSLNLNKDWRSVFGPINSRSKDEELIVRFFALYYNGDNYTRPMNKFLNDFSSVMNKQTLDKFDNIKHVFTNTIGTIHEIIGNKAFRLVRALNAAVFDAVMVGVAKRLEKNRTIDKDKFIKSYNNLLSNNEFKTACESGTAQEDSVKKRQKLAIDAFRDV